MSKYENEVNTFVKSAISDPKYQIIIRKTGAHLTADPEIAELEALIDFEQPTSKRPNKRSKVLSLVFSIEFVQKDSIKKQNVIDRLEVKIKKILENFDFENSTKASRELQPKVSYEIDAYGNIWLIN